MRKEKPSDRKCRPYIISGAIKGELKFYDFFGMGNSASLSITQAELLPINFPSLSLSLSLFAPDEPEQVYSILINSIQSDARKFMWQHSLIPLYRIFYGCPTRPRRLPLTLQESSSSSSFFLVQRGFT